MKKIILFLLICTLVAFNTPLMTNAESSNEYTFVDISEYSKSRVFASVNDGKPYGSVSEGYTFNDFNIHDFFQENAAKISNIALTRESFDANVNNGFLNNSAGTPFYYPSNLDRAITIAKYSSRLAPSVEDTIKENANLITNSVKIDIEENSYTNISFLFGQAYTFSDKYTTIDCELTYLDGTSVKNKINLTNGRNVSSSESGLFVGCCSYVYGTYSSSEFVNGGNFSLFSDVLPLDMTKELSYVTLSTSNDVTEAKIFGITLKESTKQDVIDALVNNIDSLDYDITGSNLDKNITALQNIYASMDKYGVITDDFDSLYCEKLSHVAEMTDALKKDCKTFDINSIATSKLFASDEELNDKLYWVNDDGKWIMQQVGTLGIDDYMGNQMGKCGNICILKKSAELAAGVDEAIYDCKGVRYSLPADNYNGITIRKGPYQFFETEEFNNITLHTGGCYYDGISFLATSPYYFNGGATPHVRLNAQLNVCVNYSDNTSETTVVNIDNGVLGKGSESENYLATFEGKSGSYNDSRFSGLQNVDVFSYHVDTNSSKVIDSINLYTSDNREEVKIFAISGTNVPKEIIKTQTESEIAQLIKNTDSLMRIESLLKQYESCGGDRNEIIGINEFNNAYSICVHIIPNSFSNSTDIYNVRLSLEFLNPVNESTLSYSLMYGSNKVTNSVFNMSEDKKNMTITFRNDFKYNEKYSLTIDKSLQSATDSEYALGNDFISEFTLSPTIALEEMSILDFNKNTVSDLSDLSAYRGESLDYKFIFDGVKFEEDRFVFMLALFNKQNQLVDYQKINGSFSETPNPKITGTINIPDMDGIKLECFMTGDYSDLHTFWK